MTDLQELLRPPCHPVTERPWGSYASIEAGERHLVRRLTVSPRAGLALQVHRMRSEHWVVVKGRARITRGPYVLELVENESIFIPPGMKHRLENPHDLPLEVIEVQVGDSLGDDDVVRLEDARQPV